MSNIQETEYKPNLLEKGMWWIKIGGIVAAVIGVINHSALLFEGLAVAGLSHIGQREIYKYRITAN